MRNYDVILFDLDGTLTDSAPGILNSVRYACRKLGLPIPGEETLRRFLGPPLISSFIMLAVADHDKAGLVGDARSFQCVGNDLGLVGAGLIQRGTADEIAVLR